jgi:hypothetical protein
MTFEQLIELLKVLLKDGGRTTEQLKLEIKVVKELLALFSE